MRSLEIRLKGGLLLGSGAARGYNDITLRRADGVPYIPASALKGAVREQLARLVDAEVVSAVLGGPGPDPLGEPGREERFGGGNTKVLFSDAELTNAQVAECFRRGFGYTLRAQVSIDRRSRRAADKRLFHREILAPFADGLVFTAGVEARDLSGAERRGFEAAVRAVFALGAGRSAGLGGVEMTLSPAGPESSGAAETWGETAGGLEIPEGAGLELVLEAVDPVCLGADRFVSNFHPTLAAIPASALRGAVVTAALAERGEGHVDQSSEPAFRALVLDPETCLRFGDALPLAGGDGPLPAVAPATLVTCKVDGEAHGVRDDLVAGFVRRQLAEHGLRLTPLDACPHAGCGERLVAAGQWVGTAEPKRRVVTRLAMDPGSGRGEDGKLFSLELLERGTLFIARVDGVGPEGRTLLADAARRGLRVGHGRGQGYGRVRVAEIRPAPDEPLEERVAAFDGIVRRALAAASQLAGGELGGGGGYLAALLGSDLAPPQGGGGEDALLNALGLAGAKAVHAQVRTGLRGGFNALEGRPRPFRPVVRAGSVLLLELPCLSDEVLGILRNHEARGLGEARELGLGRVRFSDPIHRPGWRNPRDER